MIARLVARLLLVFGLEALFLSLRVLADGLFPPGMWASRGFSLGVVTSCGLRRHS